VNLADAWDLVTAAVEACGPDEQEEADLVMRLAQVVCAARRRPVGDPVRSATELPVMWVALHEQGVLAGVVDVADCDDFDVDGDEDNDGDGDGE